MILGLHKNTKQEKAVWRETLDKLPRNLINLKPVH